MCRILFRGVMLSAAVLAAGAALVTTSAADGSTRTLVAEQAAGDEICLLINGVWYCFEELSGDQDSRRTAPASIS